MTPADLDRLEALARAATPGGWYVEGFSELSEHGEAVTSYCEIVMAPDQESIIADHCTTYNAAFIAAANPSTVLRLIAGCRRKM